MKYNVDLCDILLHFIRICILTPILPIIYLTSNYIDKTSPCLPFITFTIQNKTSFIPMIPSYFYFYPYLPTLSLPIFFFSRRISYLKNQTL